MSNESKPGPASSKRPKNDTQTENNKSKRMENEEDDDQIQEESFTSSNGSYNKKLGIFTNKSTSSEESSGKYYISG